MKLDLNLKKNILSPRSHPWRVTPWDKFLGPYPTFPYDLKSVFLWSVVYLKIIHSIISTKSVLKPRGVDLRKNIKICFINKVSGESLYTYLSFVFTRFKIGLIEKMRKLTSKLHRTAYTVLGNSSGAYLISAGSIKFFLQN